MRKKFLVLFLVFGLVFSGVSKAFIFLGAPAVGLMSAGEIASALTGLGLGALIGQQMGWINLPSLDTTKPDVRIPLTDLPRDRPVANPDAPVSVVPTSTPVPASACDNWNGSNTCSENFCDAVTTNGHIASYINGAEYISVLNKTPYLQGSVPSCSVNYSGIYGETNVQFHSSSSTPAGSTQTCGAGYTLSGSDCVLTNRQAIPDNKQDFEAVTQSGVIGYQGILGDPDSNPAISLSQGAALFHTMNPNYGSDPATAQPVNVAIDPMGGTTSMCPYQTCIPVAGLPGHFRISALSNTATGGQAVVIDVNKATGVVDQAAVVPLAGYVINQGQTYTDANGVVQTVQAGQIAIAQPINGSYVQSANPAVPTVQIDTSNLARTGEAASAATTVVNALHSDLQDTALDNVAPMTSINTSLDAINNNLTPKPEDQPDINFSWMPSLLPGTFTACTPFTFDVNPTLGAAAGMTGSGSIEICDKLDLARQILGWMLGALTAFLIFRIFVNSNKGAL